MRSKLFKQILVLSIPLLFKYLFFLVFVDWGVFDKNDLIEDVIFFILIAVLIHTEFFQKSIFKHLLIFAYIFYVVLETTSYLAVSSTFSSSYMYLLLESGNEELKEFALGYLSFPIICVFLTYTILFFVLRKRKWILDFKYSNAIGALCLIVITGFLKFSGFIESNAYHNAVRGTYGYYDLQKNMKFAPKVEEREVEIKANNEVLVLVLGESTDRNHMQIYDYSRNTNPLLSTKKDELYIYDNVISTDVFTLKAVPKILTSLNNESQAKGLVDIIQVFKAAGYSTYWLSNQRPISFHDNAISKIASGSTMFKFYNHLIDRDTKVLDQEILPDYEAILSKPGKKLIVLRLIGTHFDYDNRYPDAFEKFKSVDASKKEKLIDEYDNAILYNDFIVNEIISKLKSKNTKSALIYLSDHGENIYNDGTDFFGRSEEILTKNMFDIPFLLWTSDSFDKPVDFQFEKYRAFTSQFTYESIGHVFGVVHKDMKVQNSLFSSFYIPKKRIIVGGKDYDSLFKVNKKDD
ncbi:phosphoethanolamine transferase [Winogradskyella sp.]|uniref:phosphoethanolamine transferase n=1 Tax=Winogradskyella sp. TaxID=1883156 RepID=UPI0035C867BE